MPTPAITDLVTVIGNVAIALSLVVALIFGIAQVRAAERDRRERLTMDALRTFTTREFAELIRFITVNTLPKTAEELRALPKDEYILFVQLAQQMESLGMLVAEKTINIDLVDKTLGSFVTSAWEKYQPIFLSMRADDPFMAEYFQWLAETIARRMREQPRQPFQGPTRAG
jgi:hypothetical protein